MERVNIDLETFLESLPAEAAANARAAAARIDALERAAQRIGASDKRYVKLFAGAILFALAAAYLALGGADLYRAGVGDFGDVAVLGMASVFPVLLVAYSLRMRERTRIDQQKFHIIETCFLPWDGIYFPPGPESNQAMVSISSGAKAWRKPNTKDARKARMYW